VRLYNAASRKPIRRSLRAQLTTAEAALWRHLQRSQLEGRKFRRQHGVGPYVLDFYCPREHLAVELDGAAHDHETAQVFDQARERFLKKAGITVLRFENRDVLENLEGVLSEIRGSFGR
jgi:very-short-patch-repair endonuclease